MASSSRSSLTIFSRIVAAVVAAFVFVIAFPALAQRPGDRPDLRITKASFNGRDLHVEYTNATGVYDRRRYEVGFQWYDASGAPVGTRHWLPQPEVERGGIAILDTKYRTSITYRGSNGRQFDRTLPEFILQRPNAAEELRITVDDGDRVPEADETNNVARLRIPLPDLQITGATFRSPNQLELSYRNANPTLIALSFRIGFTWAAESGTHLTPTRWINVLESRDGSTTTSILSRTDASYLTPQGRQAGDRLDWYFERRPGNATRLQVTIDDAGTVREQNEQNNLVSVRPFLPDLVVRDAKLENDRLTFTYGNAGEGYIRDTASRVVFQWVNASGNPVGEPRWRTFAQMNPGQTFTVDAERFDVEYAVPGMNRTTTQRLATYLAQRPTNAAQLRIAIDDEQRITEANEQNNSATVAPPPPPQPDITITDATLTADAFRFTVRNIGQGAVSRATPISLWFEWVDAADRRVGQLAWNDVPAALVPGQFLRFDGANARLTRERASGGTETMMFADFFGGAPDSATRLKVSADGPNAIREADEANNIVRLERPRTPRPDLVVERITIDADGQPHATVWNRGESAARSVVVAHEYRDRAGKHLERGSGSRETAPLGLEPDQKIIAALLGPIPDTAATVAVTIDPKNAVAESNEQNNAKEALAPMADLVVVEAKPDANGSLALTYRNTGNRKADPLSIWLHFVDAQGAQVGPLYWMDVSPIRADGTQVLANETVFAMSSAGQVEIRAIFEQPPAGATQIKVLLDGPDRVVESNEENNVALLPIPVVPRPDFTITDPRVDADGKMYFTVRNVGTAGVTSLPVRGQWVQANGESIIGGDRIFSMSAVDAGFVSEQVAQSILPDIFPAPDAAVRIRLIADPLGRYGEINEENNVLEIALPPRMPDLAFARVTAKWNAPSSKIEYVGENRGTVDVERVVLGLQWLDANGNATGPAYPPYVVFGRLRAGATSSTWALPFWDSGETSTRSLGRYLLLPPSDATHLRLMLDPENATPESDEVNNVALVERPANVPLSDLAITSAKFAEGVFALTYQNIGPVYAGYSMKLSTWFEWVDASGARVGDLVWHDGEALDPRYATHLDIATVVSSATRAKFPLRDFLAAPPDGATHLKVSADGPNALLESDESNNTTLLPRLVVPKPDLAFTNVFLVPPKRERLVIGFQNTGKAPASEFSWTMAWVDAAGKALGEPYEGTVPALKANWQYGASSDSDDPKGKPMFIGKWLAQPKPAGAVRLEITIDPNNRIAESNEENNRRTFDEWSPPALVQSKGSDFVVGAVEVKDGALRITARNIGAGDAAATDIWLMWFGAKGALPSSGAVDLPAIVAGKETVVRVPLDGQTEASRILRDPPRDGTRLRIFLDGSRKIEESNEDNNDAMLDRAKIAPQSENKPPVADAGEDMTERDDNGDGMEVVRFYSRNSKDPDGKVVAWRWTLDGKEIATGQYPYWRTAPVGTHVVTLTVTDDKDATATDTVTVTVEPKPATPPDLVAAELTFEPRAPQVGDVVTFTVRVENRGGSRVGQVSVTSFDIDLKNDSTRDVSLAQFVTKDLESGASESISWKREYGRDYFWTATAGTHAFISCADAKGVVHESDDYNNCARRVVTVGAEEEDKEPARPDLALRTTLINRTTYTMGLQAMNLGDAPSPPFAWEFQWVDASGKAVGPPFPWVFNYPLAAGQSVGNTVQFKKLGTITSLDPYLLTHPKGATRVRVTLDPKNVIAERDEENNSRYLEPPLAELQPEAPVVPKQPDLAITGITVTPAKPAAGAKFTVSATVKNIGGASASASVISFLLDINNDDDPEQFPDSIALPSFASGQSRTVTWDDVQSASAGTHGITVCVDVNDDINEIDEDENCKDRTVTVGVATGRAPGATFASAVLDVIADIIFGGFGATPIVASDWR